MTQSRGGAQCHGLSIVLLVVLCCISGFAQPDAEWQIPPPCTRPQHSPREPPIDCYLEIVGHGQGKPGVKRLKLNCTSSYKPSYNVPVGIATDRPDSPLASSSKLLAEQLKLYGQGVEFSTHTTLPCQQQAEQPSVQQSVVPLYALLYFCEGHIRFVKPTLRDVYLPYALSDRSQQDTAVVAFAGSVSATMVGATVTGNDASTAIAVLGDAALGIKASSFQNNQGNPGSGVFARGNAAVNITSCSFQENHSSDNGGAIAAMGCSTVGITASRIVNNSADISGGGIYAIEQASLVVQNTSLLDNSAQDGGGFFVSSAVRILDSTVANNTAMVRGGGLYVMASPFAALAVADSKVTNNTANRGGGLAIVSSPVVFDPASIKLAVVDNNGAKDSDVSVEPEQLTIVGSPVVGDFVGRPDLEEGLLRVQLNLTGANGSFSCGARKVEAYWLDESLTSLSPPAWQMPPMQMTCGLGPLGQINMASPKAVGLSAPDGLVNFSFVFQQPPGTHIIHFRVALEPDEGFPCPPVATNLTVRVRPCGRGEQQVKPGVCQRCLSGTYSFSTNTTECLGCPEGAECPGGDVVVSADGYWQSSTHSDQIHRCPNPDACAGNRAMLLDACKQGNASLCADGMFVPMQCTGASAAAAGAGSAYSGHLCGTCAPGHGSPRPFHCQQCMGKGALVATYVTAGVGMLLYMKLLCHLTLSESQQQCPDGADLKDQPTHLLRQLILHAQYTLIIASVQMGEAWPGSLAWALRLLAWIWSPASPEILAPECLGLLGDSVPPAVQRVVLYLAMPLIMLVLLLAIECISVRVFQTTHKKGDTLRRLLATGLIVAFFFLPSIARTAFGLFACVQVDTPATPASDSTPMAVGRYFLYDLGQLCWSGWHRNLALGLGIPLCVLMILAPVSILVLTLRNRTRLSDQEFVQHFYFLVRYYSPKYCFWEAVVSAQTIGLVALCVFGYSLGPYKQALAINAVVLSFGLLLLIVRPLAHAKAMHVAVTGKACLFLTSYTALTFAQYGTKAVSATIPNYMGAIVVLANAAFVLWVVWQLVCLIDWYSVWHTTVGVCKAVAACEFSGGLPVVAQKVQHKPTAFGKQQQVQQPELQECKV